MGQRTCLWIAALALFGSSCAMDDAHSSASLTEPPLVDTGPWLTTVPSPPAAWRRVLSERTDVVRHRFVRFSPPDRLPDVESRFIVRPFSDTRIVLRMRRAGPSGEGAWSWFGAYSDDPRGYGGIVVRPNGRVAAEIHAPDGRRFQVVNVASGAYAVLELEPLDSEGGAE
jgi:hypothetical protein